MIPPLKDLMGQVIAAGDIVTFGTSGDGSTRIAKVEEVKQVVKERYNHREGKSEPYVEWKVTVRSVYRWGKAHWGGTAVPRNNALVKLPYTVAQVEEIFGIDG